jgi:glycosyltransferase involved in cell wall biosynthesis
VLTKARPPHGSKLRIAYIDHCAQLSGAELGLLRLLPAMPEVDAHVILAEDGPLVPSLRKAGVSTQILPLASRSRNLRRKDAALSRQNLLAILSTLLYALRLSGRLRELKPDLVHTYSLKAALYGGLAGRLLGIPVVWHLHDRIAEDYLPPAAVRLVRRFGPRFSDAVIANSEASLKTLGLMPASVSSWVIEYPIMQSSVTWLPRRSVFTIGMVGRLAPWKGQHIFIEAFARAFPDGPERAVIVGAPLFGEDGYERELRVQTRTLGLNGRVEFAGFREDIQAELRGFDVLVHASTIPEPFGQVVLEGMAAGLAVVASGAGGPSEVIEDGVTGLLFTPSDVDELALTLRRLAADAGLRERLGLAGRQRAQKFSPDAIAGQVLGVYTSLLGHTGRLAPK